MNNEAVLRVQVYYPAGKNIRSGYIRQGEAHRNRSKFELLVDAGEEKGACEKSRRKYIHF